MKRPQPISQGEKEGHKTHQEPEDRGSFYFSCYVLASLCFVLRPLSSTLGNVSDKANQLKAHLLLVVAHYQQPESTLRVTTQEQGPATQSYTGWSTGGDSEAQYHSSSTRARHTSPWWEEWTNGGGRSGQTAEKENYLFIKITSHFSEILEA